MFPAASVTTPIVKPVQPAVQQSALRAALPQAPQTARSSAGEASAANIPAESVKAIRASEQSAVAPRLRDQETAESSERRGVRRHNRDMPEKDSPTGPPPAFAESLLERQARFALDPPDVPSADARANEPPEPAKIEVGQAPANTDPPPTPSERAEASFAETREFSEPKEPASVDVEI